MRIRKRLAAISAGLGGLHHVQPPAAGPTMPSQPISRAGCSSSELHVVVQEENSTKSTSHAYKQQVSQTRRQKFQHEEGEAPVSHERRRQSLAGYRSETPSTEVCSAAGLEDPSPADGSHTISSPAAAQHENHSHGGSSLTAPTLPLKTHTVELACDFDVVHDYYMAPCTDPYKVSRRQYADLQHGKLGLSWQNAYGASLACGTPPSIDARQCKQPELQDVECAGMRRREMVATVTKPQRLSTGGQQSTLLPSVNAADVDKVDMLTTAGTQRSPTDPISSSILKDNHVSWPEHMSIGEESGVPSCLAQGGDNGDLQRLARDLIRNNVKASIKTSVCNEGKVLKSEILHETSANFKQSHTRINVSKAISDAVQNGEEKNNQDQGGGEDERCWRRSGRGWQCKNMRAAGGSSIYCNYHQRKIHQNHASWNARNKTMKENKRKREMIEPEASIQPRQHKMVDVKMFELPLLPSKQHMYENVRAHDAISSEADAIFKRMFQATAITEKREFSTNMGTDPAQNSTALPSLVETVVLPARPCTQYAQDNSESQGLGNLNFKRRRIEKVAEALEYIAVDDEKFNCGVGMLSSKVQHGVDDSAAHKIHDVDKYSGAHKEELDEEIMQCKRMDGRGWQCRNMHRPNSTYCYHHQLKLSKHYRKRGQKGRIHHTHFITDTNTLTREHLQMINPSCGMQGHKDGDVSNLQKEIGISMEDDGIQGELYENGYPEGERWVHVSDQRGESKNQQGLQGHFQDDIEHGVCDKSANNGLRFQQMQQEQLQWWEYKQGGKDSTLISEKGHTGKQADLLLPRRSERRLIIDICKSTAAEHEQIKDKMGTHDHARPQRQPNDMAAINDELLQQEILHTTIPPKTEYSHNMELIDMKNAQQVQNTEQRQCKRHDGRGWQCKRMCEQGKFYCEHHLVMLRNYVEKTDAKSKVRLQQRSVAKQALRPQKQSPKSEDNIMSNEPELQTIVVKKIDHRLHKQQVREGSCSVWNDLGSTEKHAIKHRSDDVQEQMKQVQREPHKRDSNGSLQGQKRRAESQGNHKRKSNEAAGAEPLQEPERNFKQQQELKQAEAHEAGQRRCGRHDGRGWQCKSMCKRGSLYCEYHREKLRRNHATWNAKKLEEKQRNSLLIAAGTKRKLCMKEEEATANVQQVNEDEESKVQESLRAGRDLLSKKKMRSLQDIVARFAT